MSTTFRSWLFTQTERRDPVGDLARDTKADRSCWRGQTAHSLRRHIKDEHDGIPEAVAAVNTAWKDWMRWLPTAPTPRTRRAMDRATLRAMDRGYRP